jgi:hypothetical protein
MKATRATPAPSQVDNTDACIAHNLAKMNTSPMSVTVGLLWERLKALEAVSKPPASPPFVPVVVTLETQEEVDAVYAMLRHSFARGFACRGFGNWPGELKDFISSEHDNIYCRLRDLAL